MDNTKIIINTKLIQVHHTSSGYVPIIRCEDGSAVEHQTLPNSQEGLVAALMLAADVNAGKFWLKSVMARRLEPVGQIEDKTK